MNTIQDITTYATVTSPDGGTALGEVELTPPGQVPALVAAAREAQPGWAELPVRERAETLLEAARRLEPQAPALARLLAAESGKPLVQAEREVLGAIELLRANGEVARRATGTVLATEGHPGTERDLAYTRREPLGVVAAVLPFNFPVELYVEKCAAALVGGNAVIVKPPLEDPLAVTRVHDTLLAAGIPPAVLQLANGDAAVGAALAADAGVDAVSLTGSTAAGVSVARAAAPRLRRLHLELGGNNAALVLADADLGLAERELSFGRLLMNGQACSASKRIIVDRSLHDELAERLCAVASRQRVGSPLALETTIGPLISPAAAARVETQVAAAVQGGARLIAGSGRARGPYFEPCVLADVPPDAGVAVDDEIFGPVFALIPVSDPGEALAVANASSFGLMASVFSADLQFALALAERLQAGGVVINGSDNYRPPVIPFGGLKMSGDGREGVGFTFEELTREKTIVLRRFRTGMSHGSAEREQR